MEKCLTFHLDVRFPNDNSKKLEDLTVPLHENTATVDLSNHENVPSAFTLTIDYSEALGDITLNYLLPDGTNGSTSLSKSKPEFEDCIVSIDLVNRMEEYRSQREQYLTQKMSKSGLENEACK